MSQITCTNLECGAVLVAEPIDNVASVAVNWLLPMGTATDPADGDGLACMLSELVFRGAGELSSRDHSDAFDRLGVERSSSATTWHLRLSAACLGDRLDETLRLLALMVRRPALPADAVPAVRSLCLQSLEGLDDDPQHLVMLRLHEQHHPPPFNRDGYGRRDVLEGCTPEQLRASWAARCHPRDTIVSVAGAIDPAAVAECLDELLAGWGGAHDEPQETGPPAGGQRHLEQGTAQVHIGIAAAAPPESDEHSMLERLAIGVLSGGTSARLFTEVRQKRSLCYSVSASYRAGRYRGQVALYAGTTPERAQETLDVCVAELRRLSEGVTAEELARAAIGLKSHLIMQGESTSARAMTIARDRFRIGRPRTLDEMAAAIDAVTPEQLNEYLAARPHGPFTLTTIGPVAPEMPADLVGSAVGV